MSKEIFVCNGFAFNVRAILTSSVIDAEKCFEDFRHLWTVVEVGNVLPVPFSRDSDLPCLVDSLVALEATSEECSPIEHHSNQDALFLSVFYVNLEGQPVRLQDNYVVKEGVVYIISLSGDISQSDPVDHWTDVDGNLHKPIPCEECHRCRSIESSLEACSSCFYVINISTLQSAMRCVLDVGVSDLLIKLANELYIEPATKGYEQTKEIKERLLEKSKQYALIESEAKRFVAMTKEYGQRVQEAYDEYEEEENYDEFAATAENTKGLRHKFEEVTNKHAELINEVDVLKNEAQKGQLEMIDAAKKLQSREAFQQAMTTTGTSTLGGGLGGGLVAAGIRGAPAIGEAGAPMIARFVSVVGRGGAVGLAVAGSAALIGILGYGGFKLYKKLVKSGTTNFAYLAKSFEEISLGVENVSRHLRLIEDSLRNIESKWRSIVDEDGKLIGAGAGVRRSTSSTSDVAMDVENEATPQSSSESSLKVTEKLTRKEKRLAKNIVTKVRELMNACEGYEKRTSGSRLSLKWK